jgi:ubiquinone biosynthesis protein
MFRALRNILRLLVIARTLARHGALAPLRDVLQGAGLAPALLFLAELFSRTPTARAVALRPGERLAEALTELGPAFIKLGQMLSTRSDLLGEQVASDLSRLQDRLAPFPASEARAAIAAAFGQPVEMLFESFDDRPVSAASIAQVHYAVVRATREPGDRAQDTRDAAGAPIEPPIETGIEPREVAVKILRPGIEAALARDIDLLYWIAEWVETTQPRLRRLKPVEVVATFAATVRTEMDLRLEAAAASELAENFADDPTYRVPEVDWRRTARRVMTQARLTGIAMDDREAMAAAGLDIDEVLARAAAIFFRQVFRDGYFHGDQHPGNMVVDDDGNIGAVDFGIMGRLDRKNRYYLADMLLAFLERNYPRIAQVHFDAGFVPAHHSPEDFAQACRSIGEPIFGRPLHEISFARLLGQLFRITEQFDMETQPQLLLLQKNMLMAEGVSRRLNPRLNIWVLAQPLIAEWMRENRGPEARIRDFASELGRIGERLPTLLADLEKVVAMTADGGFKLHPETLSAFAKGQKGRSHIWALWVAVAALALAVLFG